MSRFFRGTFLFFRVIDVKVSHRYAHLYILSKKSILIFEKIFFWIFFVINLFYLGARKICIKKSIFTFFIVTVYSNKVKRGIFFSKEMCFHRVTDSVNDKIAFIIIGVVFIINSTYYLYKNINTLGDRKNKFI